MNTAQDWITALGLVPHPEGGHYRETFRGKTDPDGVPSSTAIYFLLQGQDISAFHRIKGDEVWHLYAATPKTRLHVWQITPAGRLEGFLLGTELGAGEGFQDVVPGGDWFAAEIETDDFGDRASAWVLVGCTVSPGFRFEDFELARAADLAAQFPAHADLIRRLSLP